MTQTDTLTRFLIEDLNIRGQLLVLEQTTQEAFGKHPYPEAIREQLGEALCCALLLSATLKIEGSTALQARGDGPMTLLMAEATESQTVRGLARWDEQDSNASSNPMGLRDLLGANAALSITLTPRVGQRYQGIVPLEKNNLAACLEDYFGHSEQLMTSVQLFRQGTRIAGLLLQELPTSSESAEREANWQHVQSLAQTLQADEATQLDANTVLRRLFHQHDVRVLDARPAGFACTCSEQRTLNALKALEESVLHEILQEQGHIEMNCEFCGHRYQFNRDQISQLLGGPRIH